MSFARAPDRGDALIWWLGAGVLVAATLVSRYLVPVDETRYAAVAWEMWQRGDFLVPYLNGEPYSHKPPLLFWLLQAGWALLGVNDWWPRVGPGLVSVVALYLVAKVGRQLWPQQPQVGPAAATMALGLALWAFFTPVLMFDLLLAATVLASLLGVLRAAAGSRSGWVLAGVGLGLGVLTKGPVALLHVLPVALLAPWWAQPLRSWGRWYAGVAGMVALAAAVALAWAVPAALRGGEQYAQAIFWGQTAGRVVESFAHQRAWWWYLQWLPVVLFPWVVWWPLWRAAVRRRGALMNDRGVRFCLGWALPVMLAFMAVSGKQLHYLLPLLPAIALAGVRLLQLDESAAGGLAQAPVTLVYVVIGALLIVVPGLQEARGWPAWVADIPMSAGIALMAVGVGILAPPGPMAALRRLRIVTLAQLAAVTALIIAVMGPASPYYDTRPAAGLLAQAQADGRPVAHVGKYHGQFNFPGRLTQPLDEIGRAQTLEWARTHPRGLIVAYDDGGRDGVPPQFSQPYRGSRLVVYAAGTVADHPQLIRSLSD